MFRGGVLALQGAFEEHQRALESVSPSVVTVQIRTPDQLSSIDGPKGGGTSAQERGGVMTSVITDVNGVMAKTTACMVAIGRDASLITSGARSRTWPCNNEGGWRFRDTN